jgi:DNA-directed RNA polymerase specialized sigma24 family protein
VPKLSATPKPAAVKRLVRLNERTIACDAHCAELRDQRALAILATLEEGVTVRVLADAIGVSSSAVQHWANRGRQLRR